MKFTCTQENLQRGLGQVVPVAGRSTQLPALQHVLLQAKENMMHLTTTDLEVGVHTMVGGKVEQGGTVTVPARRLLDYVGQLPNKQPLTLLVDKQGLQVKTEGFQAVFPVADAEEFPLLPEGEREAAIEVAGPAFCEAVHKVMFAASREEARPEIKSVFLKAEGGELRLAATDSFRLAEEIMTVDEGVEFELLLPLSAANELVRLFVDQKRITIDPHEAHVLFFGDSMELSSRLIDGRYPDYRQIIPDSWTTRVAVHRLELIRALKTLLVFLSRDSRRVSLELQPAHSRLRAQAAGAEAGQGEVSVFCEGEGKELPVLLNIQYLLEGLQHIEDDRCVIEGNGAQAPVVLRPEDRQGYVYVVMPIQST